MMSILKKEVLAENLKQMIQSTRSKQQDLVHLWDANGMYFMKIRNSLVAFPGGGFYVLHLFLGQLLAVGFQDVIGKISKFYQVWILSPTWRICQQFNVINTI